MFSFCYSTLVGHFFHSIIQSSFSSLLFFMILRQGKKKTDEGKEFSFLSVFLSLAHMHFSFLLCSISQRKADESVAHTYTHSSKFPIRKKYCPMSSSSNVYITIVSEKEREKGEKEKNWHWRKNRKHFYI